MAHKSLVGGTAYDISGGRTLVGGTGYSISKGRTLVGGTGYDISFFPHIGTPLNNLTWEEIRTISDAGLAKDYFSVGDIKTITINGKVGSTTFSNLTVECFLIGTDHNSAIEGTNKIHFQIGKIGGVEVALIDGNYGGYGSTSGWFTMNTKNTNAGGWAACHMRKTVRGSDSDPTSPRANTLLAALPADLRAVMKAVTKYTVNANYNQDKEASATATTEYLPLLAARELNESTSAASSYEKSYQAEYDYYKAGNNTVKKKHNATGTACGWWLRSPYKSNAANFCWGAAASADRVSNKSAYYSYGVSPLFCV